MKEKNAPGSHVAKALPADFSFSQASLQDYADCPLRFRLRYMDQLDWPALESQPADAFEQRMADGSRFHRLVQQHLSGMPVELIRRSANSPDLVRWWSNYERSLPAPTDAELKPEARLTCSVGPARVVAQCDLLAISSERLTIYDWKTSSRRPPYKWLEERWQTRVYLAVLQKCAPALMGEPLAEENMQMIYWFAEHPEEPAILRYSAQQAEQDWKRIEATVGEIISRREFARTLDDRQCHFCPFRSYCDRGTSAGEVSARDDEGWQELPTPPVEESLSGTL